MNEHHIWTFWNGHHNRMFWVNIIIGSLLIAYIGVRTEITAKRQERHNIEVVELSAGTRQCLHELIEALAARSYIAQESDRLNNDQHQVLSDMFAALGQANTSEARRVVMAEFLPRINQAQQLQENLLLSRSEHPLPDPNCPIIESRQGTP